MKKKRIIGTFLLFMLIFQAEFCLAAENEGQEQIETIQQETESAILGELDFSEIDENISNLLPNEKIRFKDVIGTLINGEYEKIGSMILRFISDQISYEFRTNRHNLIHILMIAVVAAIFDNFSAAVQSRQISEMGFYVLYVLLITICLNTFRIAVSGVEQSLENILNFMSVFCPGYFLVMAIPTGSSSAVWFYNLVLLLIFLIEMLMLRFLIPVIHVYIMVQIMNHLFPEDILGKMADLLKKFVGWFLKFIMGIVVGINIVQALLAPAVDVLKRSTITKTLESIPGLGNIFGSATDVILGTAVLLKNGVGMAGAVILLIICIVPILQMLLLTFMYQFAAAVVQPVSDKRVVECISSVGEGYEMIMKVLLTTMILFLLTIAIAAAATS